MIAGILTGTLAFYAWKDKYKLNESQIGINAMNSSNAEKIDSAKTEADKKIFDGRAAIISYIEKNISRLSPERSANNLTWRATKIWFIDEKNFYVDYKDEVSTTRRLLMSQTVDGPAAEYKIIGYFTPGDKGWNLKSGKDAEGAVALKLYEKNEQSNEWVAK